MMCGMQGSLSKWISGMKCSSVLFLWIPCIILVFKAQHNCLRVFRTVQLQGAGVSHILVCTIWQQTLETINFSAYPFHIRTGLWSSTKIAFDGGHFQGAASSSSDSQLVWEISWWPPSFLHRCLIWVDPFCIHHRLLQRFM